MCVFAKLNYAARALWGALFVGITEQENSSNYFVVKVLYAKRMQNCDGLSTTKCHSILILIPARKLEFANLSEMNVGDWGIIKTMVPKKIVLGLR